MIDTRKRLENVFYHIHTISIPLGNQMVITYFTLETITELIMWELLSFLQGKTRRICLEQLANGPKTPGQITNKVEQHLSHISRGIRELEEKGLVVCVTPGTHKNRFYKITEKGLRVLEELKKIDDELQQ